MYNIIYYVVTEYDTVCYTPEYIYYFWVLAMPFLIFWVFLFPVIIWFILYRNRDNLSEQVLRLSLGSFLIAMNDEAYYWGAR